MHKWLPVVNKQKFTPPRQVTKRGSDRRSSGVTEFVHCYIYSVVDLQTIMWIRMHVTLVYPIYPPPFAFHAQHSLEANCLQTLLVWTWRWGEHFYLFREAIYESACTYLSLLYKIKKWGSMSSPFLTEPVTLWEYLSLHRHKYNY